MIITIELPENLAEQLGIADSADLPRMALEAIALEALRQRKITEAELGRILGITDRYARDGFLKTHGVELDYTWEDLERERAAFRAAGLCR